MALYDDLSKYTTDLKNSLAELRQTEDEFNGENGLPKCDREEVLQYMSDNQIKSPRQAFQQMKEPEFAEFKKNQLNSPTNKDNLSSKVDAAMKGLL